jgi:hypothetical protein
MMRHTIPTLAVLAAAVALAGCETKPAAGAIPRRTFVRANVDMRSVPDTVAGGDSLRKAALRKHRVTEADLRKFVDVHGRDPEYLASVWREVSDSVQKRWELTFPSMAERHGVTPGAVPGTEPATAITRPGAIPGLETDIPGAPANPRTIVRPPDARTPPPPPNQPPPEFVRPPRPMVRPPQGPPPDARGPSTVPVRRPVVTPPRDSQ